MVDKILEAVAKFRGHFRTQWGRLPWENLELTISSKFENFEKYYACMQNFRQICFWENFNVGQTVLDTDLRTLAKIR